MKSTKTYAEKLRDPRWQKKRLEVLEAAKWACANCKDTQNTLNVHHKAYKRGKDPWEYGLSELLCLCEMCHKNMHDKSLPDWRMASGGAPIPDPEWFHDFEYEVSPGVHLGRWPGGDFYIVLWEVNPPVPLCHGIKSYEQACKLAKAIGEQVGAVAMSFCSHYAKSMGHK